MHLREVKDSRRCPSLATTDHERGKTERERPHKRATQGSHKSVSMAPTSRYLTDRQYVMRKPLFAAEQQTSILKKTHPWKHREEEKEMAMSRREENQQHMTRAREELKSFSLSHGDSLLPSASREDLDSPLGASELRARLCHEEPTFGSSFPGSRSTQRSLSSSILEVQRINPPLRPRLTSTVLYPTYTPRSRPGQTQLRRGGREEGGGREVHSMSSHQANYWACAIPKALPPSPDRHSTGWDPNREYQALLDYTYPLRPGQVVSEWDSSELHGDSLLQTDPDLQDSGIDLHHLCSSTSMSGLGLSVSNTGQARETSTPSGGHRSPDLQGFTTPSDGVLCLTDAGALSVESLDHSQNTGERHLYKSNGRLNQSTAFIRSTSVLPQSRCVCGEVDEEFWPLPEQLEELQLLSRQVRQVTAQLSQPVTTSWESLGQGTTSILSSITLPEKQEAEDRESEAEVQEPDSNSQHTDEGKDEMSREESSAAQTAVDQEDHGAVMRDSRASVDPVGGGLSLSSLREVEVLVEQLCGLTLPGNQRSSQEDREQSDSLMQHIQVFCSHLEQLMKRLYTVSEKMELLAAPIVDIDGVKSSLAEYQSFQREVSNHQPLASCVLHTGQLLLSCINTTSPFLRDTLLLIERQSGALETHTEHFFSSILSAMDSLTQPSPPSPVQQSGEEDPGPGRLQGTTL